MKKIPFYLAGLFLFALTLLFFFFSLQSFHRLRNRTFLLIEEAKNSYASRKKKNDFIFLYQQSSPRYLEEKIESLLFLQEEIKKMQPLENHLIFSLSTTMQERLRFLTKENRLCFFEKEIRSNSKVREVEETQKKGVEVSANDLTALLKNIEEKPSQEEHKPQLIIQEFTLQPKEGHYELEMQLLNREFK